MYRSQGRVEKKNVKILVIFMRCAVIRSCAIILRTLYRCYDYNIFHNYCRKHAYIVHSLF